jgi:hypothetical protein
MAKARNSIFGRGDEPYGNATLGPVLDPWHLYAYGFRRAADILLEHVETRHTSLDVIVFPVVFLLRHHLELAIKIVARDARLLFGVPPPVKPHHRLRELWDEAKELIVRAEGIEPAGLEPIDVAVSQLDAVDSTSTTFRYPETVSGANPLLGTTNINLLTLRDSLEPAFDMLDAGHQALKMRTDEP